MGGVNRLRAVGGTQQLQGLSLRLDGRGESLLRGVRDTQQLQALSVRLDGRGDSSQTSYTAATRFINET